MFKLFTDTTANIPLDIQVEYNISVLPLWLDIDGKAQMENEVNTSNLYKNIQKTRIIPESKPLEKDYIYSAFEKEIVDGNEIIAVFLSATFSDTYSNAREAAKELTDKYSNAKITVIDSRTCGMEEGMAILAAAEKIRQGASREDVLNAAKNSKKYTRFMMIPEKLRFLEYEGRISKQQALFGDMIQLTPIVTATDGKVELQENAHTQHRALERVLKLMEDDIKKFGLKRLIIHHVDDFDKALDLAEKAGKIAGTEAIVSELGPGLGMRFGPGTIGVVYQTDKEIIA